MSNEARVTCNMVIVKRSGSLLLIDYQSRPSSFVADVDGTKGPTPGAIQVLTTITLVDLSQLTTPGFCYLHNQDPDNYVEWGLYELDSGDFMPLGEIGPGEGYPIKFSRNLHERYDNTGTGTTGSALRFAMRANTAPCNIRVEAFER